MPIIALFSDFGVTDPYVGLMKLAIYKQAPNCKVIDICHDLPAFNPNASGRLLQALVNDLPRDAIVLAIVDPGVGSERHPLWLEIDGRHYIGPDNGLFARIANEANDVNAHIIQYDPSKVSASFHGRDVFAPTVAQLVNGITPQIECFDTNKLVGRDWPKEVLEIIYIDHYGNAMTGISAQSLSPDVRVHIKHAKLNYARTFSEVKRGDLFWYKNSLGLVELSARNCSITNILNLTVGELSIVS